VWSTKMNGKSWLSLPKACGTEVLKIYHRPCTLLPNPSLHPTCYGWLRQPTQAGELKR
jgi:hypothetical protein